MLEALRLGLENKNAVDIRQAKHLLPGEYTEYDFAPIPHNDDYILDYHRPYIDDVVFEQNGKKMNRIEEVFDTWFDSGSMPFAINHYPFNKENFDPGEGMFGKEKGFPADFIAEGLDQTRGWFYTLLALNTALFKKSPYKNVIVNGLVLAEDGRKMSKSLRNYPPVENILDKYGADAMRYYMISSPIVRSEPLNFSEKGVDEVLKKITNRLLNVVSFYEMYAANEFTESDVRPDSSNHLDQWILARLSEVYEEVTKSMEKYELDRASRPILDFVDDLSTWYLRRSRDRFKNGNEADKNLATKTMAYVLVNLSKILAPFMPFLAEEVYQRMVGSKLTNGNKSIHLTKWPDLVKAENKIISDMTVIRDLVTCALEARDKINIKVRQPLQTLFVSEKINKISPDLLAIVTEEVNVKEIKSDASLKDLEVKLDSVISEELKLEGVARELIRAIQNLRKNTKLNPADSIVLSVKTDEKGRKVITAFESEIKKTANIKSINFISETNSSEFETVTAEDFNFEIKI
jgi:isoleucyl-tRNA synthetase